MSADGMRRLRDRPPCGIRPLHEQRGMYHERVSSKAGDDRVSLTAEGSREREALLADLMDVKRDDAFVRWPAEQ